MKTLTIIGCRWFEKTYGNTYCSAEIIADGENLGHTGRHYGYDNHFLTVAGEFLERNKFIPPLKTSLYWWCKDQGVELNYTAADVSREADLGPVKENWRGPVAGA